MHFSPQTTKHTIIIKSIQMAAYMILTRSPSQVGVGVLYDGVVQVSDRLRRGNSVVIYQGHIFRSLGISHHLPDETENKGNDCNGIISTTVMI